MPDQPKRFDSLPIVVLAVAVLIGLLVWWGFPVIQGWMANQDCVAVGRTNCGS